MSDAQRDEWLFKTEPLQGARPRWDEDGRPPVVFDQTGVVDMEAAGKGGGAVSRNVEQRGAPTPMLPPEQRILQEEEVRTPRGRRLMDTGAIGRLNISYLQEGHK